MLGIINAFKWLINAIKMIFTFIMNFFKSIGMLFSYLIHIVNVAFSVILTLPPFIQAFAYITLAISIIYIIVGRNSGKSG